MICLQILCWDSAELCPAADGGIHVPRSSDDDDDVIWYVYRYYAGIALSCVLLLMVAFMYVGLCFGACGETAGDEAGLCNRGTGACLLLTYVSHFISFTCCMFHMLLLMYFKTVIQLQ